MIRRFRYSFLLYYSKDFTEKTSENTAILLKKYNLIPNIFFTSNLNEVINSSNIIYNKLKLSNVPVYRSFYFDYNYYKNFNNTHTTKNLLDLYKLNTLDFQYNKNKLHKNELYKYSSKLFLPFYNNNVIDQMKQNKFPLIITDKLFTLFFMKNILKINYSYDYEKNLSEENIFLINLYNNFDYKEMFLL